MGRGRDGGRGGGRRVTALRLHAAAIRLLRGVRAADAASGVSAARLSVLSVLVFAGPRSPGALAAAEQVTAATMTRLIDGLERDGYVRRARDPADGRSVIVSALPRARAVLESARDRRVTLLLERLGSLDDAEWERIEAALAVLEPVLEG
jgi:DNA-binding MarR family transcriptional regulator